MSNEMPLELVPGVEPVRQKCTNCGLVTDHFTLRQPYGVCFRIPLMRRPLWSTHVAYALVCGNCYWSTPISAQAAAAASSQHRENPSDDLPHSATEDLAEQVVVETISITTAGVKKTPVPTIEQSSTRRDSTKYTGATISLGLLFVGLAYLVWTAADAPHIPIADPAEGSHDAHVTAKVNPKNVIDDGEVREQIAEGLPKSKALETTEEAQKAVDIDPSSDLVEAHAVSESPPSTVQPESNGSHSVKLSGRLQARSKRDEPLITSSGTVVAVGGDIRVGFESFCEVLFDRPVALMPHSRLNVFRRTEPLASPAFVGTLDIVRQRGNQVVGKGNGFRPIIGDIVVVEVNQTID